MAFSGKQLAANSDKEEVAIRFNLKEERYLKKNLQTLELEKTYSANLMDLNKRLVKFQYKRLKERVSKIKSNLTAQEISECKRQELEGKLTPRLSSVRSNSASRIEAHARHLKLSGYSSAPVTTRSRPQTASPRRSNMVTPQSTIRPRPLTATPSRTFEKSPALSEQNEISKANKNNRVMDVFISSKADDSKSKSNEITNGVVGRKENLKTDNLSELGTFRQESKTLVIIDEDSQSEDNLNFDAQNNEQDGNKISDLKNDNHAPKQPSTKKESSYINNKENKVKQSADGIIICYKEETPTENKNAPSECQLLGEILKDKPSDVADDKKDNTPNPPLAKISEISENIDDFDVNDKSISHEKENITDKELKQPESCKIDSIQNNIKDDNTQERGIRKLAILKENDINNEKSNVTDSNKTENTKTKNTVKTPTKKKSVKTGSNGKNNKTTNKTGKEHNTLDSKLKKTTINSTPDDKKDTSLRLDLEKGRVNKAGLFDIKTSYSNNNNNSTGNDVTDNNTQIQRRRPSSAMVAREQKPLNYSAPQRPQSYRPRRLSREFSSHSAVQKEMVRDQSRSPSPNRRKSFKSINDYDLDSDEEDIQEEQLEELLLEEQENAEALGTRVENFMERLSNYLRESSTKPTSSGNYNRLIDKPTKRQSIWELQRQKSQSFRYYKTEISKNLSKNEKIWKDIRKCTYLRVPEGVIDLSGIKTLATDKYDRFRILRAGSKYRQYDET